jgi:hypothetical protein
MVRRQIPDEGDDPRLHGSPAFDLFSLSMNMRKPASVSAANKDPAAVSPDAPTELVCLALALALLALLARIASLW